MIIHCTKCDHEWEITFREVCYSCGTADPEYHVLGCMIMTCDWCDSPGKLIDRKNKELPPIEEVMRDLAEMHKKREWEEDNGKGSD